jgi:hypothetical protein
VPLCKSCEATGVQREGRTLAGILRAKGVQESDIQRMGPDVDLDVWCDECFADMVTVLQYLLDHPKGATEDQIVAALKRQSVRKEYWTEV